LKIGNPFVGAAFVGRSIGFASVTFEYSMTYRARPSRFWRSWPNRRPRNGSHNSQIWCEGRPAVRSQGHLSRYLREAETQEIVITRHGKPAEVLIGFESEEGWFEYRLENDPRFLRRIEQARESLRAGRGVRLEDVEKE
jgi:prevent-host-death family protein